MISIDKGADEEMMEKEGLGATTSFYPRLGYREWPSRGQGGCGVRGLGIEWPPARVARRSGQQSSLVFWGYFPSWILGAAAAKCLSAGEGREGKICSKGVVHHTVLFTLLPDGEK